MLIYYAITDWIIKKYKILKPFCLSLISNKKNKIIKPSFLSSINNKKIQNTLLSCISLIFA